MHLMPEMNSFVPDRFHSVFYSSFFVAYSLSVACTGTQQLNFLTSDDVIDHQRVLDERDILRK